MIWISFLYGCKLRCLCYLCCHSAALVAALLYLLSNLGSVLLVYCRPVPSDGVVCVGFDCPRLAFLVAELSCMLTPAHKVATLLAYTLAQAVWLCGHATAVCV